MGRKIWRSQPYTFSLDVIGFIVVDIVPKKELGLITQICTECPWMCRVYDRTNICPSTPVEGLDVNKIANLHFRK